MRLEHNRNWPLVRFGDVAKNVAETCRDAQAEGLERYVGLEHLDGECLHIRRWGDLAVDEVSFTRRFREGQVLFGKRRAYQRKVAVAEFDGVCSSDILCFEPKDPKVLLPELLPFIVQSDGFFDHALGTSAGSLSPRTRWSQLKDYEFPLPPLDEQRRIAELLWGADVAAGEWVHVQDRLRQAINSITHEAFHPGVAKTRPGWRCCKLREVAFVQTGLALGRRNLAGETCKLPYLRVANVQAGHLDLAEMKIVKVPVGEVERYRVQEGDVLLTEGGDFDKLGRGTVWRNEIADCLHQNHVFCVRANRALLIPEFLSYQTSSHYGRSYFLKCAKKTSNLASVNSTQVKSFPLLLPRLDEQRRLVGNIRPIEEEMDAVQGHLARLLTVKKAVSDRFTGGGLK
jgi:restriction endonuclease S subunit